MIPWRRASPTIVCTEATTTMTAATEALQQRAAFPHSAARIARAIAWSRPRVAGDAILVGLIGLPIDKAFMMLLDEHLPLRARLIPNALLARACRIQRRLLARFAIDVGSGIDRVGSAHGGWRCSSPRPSEYRRVHASAAGM
jgi:hypothetical protein